MKAGLVGRGIGPSLTPEMHEAEGRALGLDYSYVRLDTGHPPWQGRGLADALDHAETRGFAGLNITHPHKAEVTSYLDALAGPAADLGTVNTVVFRDGRRIGHNTDYSGFRAALRASGLEVRDQSVVQFGAGGAGAATALALIDEGAQLALTDLSQDQARATATRLARARPGAQIRACAMAEIDLAKMTGAVNATPLGMTAYPGCAFDPAGLPATGWVADIVYFPLDTALVQEARRLGLRVLDGGGMALHQAIGAFELITGHSPDPGRMQRSFAALLDSRDGPRIADSG